MSSELREDLNELFSKHMELEDLIKNRASRDFEKKLIDFALLDLRASEIPFEQRIYSLSVYHLQPLEAE